MKFIVKVDLANFPITSYDIEEFKKKQRDFRDSYEKRARSIKLYQTTEKVAVLWANSNNVLLLLLSIMKFRLRELK